MSRPFHQGSERGRSITPTIYIRLRSSLLDLRRVTKLVSHRSFAARYALKLMDLEAGTHPESWLFEPHQKYILQRLEGTTTGVAVNLAAMQRMHLRGLQYTLAKRAVEITSLNQVQPSCKDELHDYVQAVQDYEYMRQCLKKRIDDPFHLTVQRGGDEEELLDKATNNLSDSVISALDERKPEKRLETDPVGHTRSDVTGLQDLRQFYRRLGLAMAGGAFLIVPMWIMVLHNTLYTGLVSTTVFVTFSGMLSTYHLREENDVISTTAAYAAVLVVFVGLQTQS